MCFYSVVIENVVIDDALFGMGANNGKRCESEGTRCFLKSLIVFFLYFFFNSPLDPDHGRIE